MTLVGYWDFRNGSLANLVDGSLATNNGATLTTDHLGYNNGAFQGNTGGIEIGTSKLAGKGIKSITIIYNDSIYGNSNIAAIISLGLTGNNTTYEWFSLRNGPGYSGNSGIYGGWVSSAGSIESGIGIPNILLQPNQWNIITIVLGPKIYNNITGFKCVLNGQDITSQLINESWSTSYGFPTETGRERFLQYSTNGNVNTSGQLSLVMIHTKELTISQIKNLHKLLMKP